MTDSPICTSCHSPLPPDAPCGICPKCLLQAGMTAGVEKGNFLPPDPEDLNAFFADYEIHELIGMGGMGAVYRAHQNRLDRQVAIKILPPEVGQSPAFAARFEREAQTMAKLNHANIVQIHDFGRTGDYYFFVMEYVAGVTLRHIIENGGLSPQESLRIIPDICSALQFAHQSGIVHRDIKPENILLAKNGQIKIADFGLAMLLEKEPKNITLTQTNQVMGTLHYMAPEQMRTGRNIDHRADLFSLGVVFYELLTGDLPIGRFESPSRKFHLDVRLDEVVLRALDADPEKRYQHASEIREAVENLVFPMPPETKETVKEAQFLSNHGKRIADPNPTVGIQLILFVAGNFWLFATICFLFGRTTERTEPLMYSFFGMGPWLYPSVYNGLFFFTGAVSLIFFIALGRSFIQRTGITKNQKVEFTDTFTVEKNTSAIPIKNPFIENSQGTAKYSRAAIIGACWAPFFFPMVFLMFNVQSTTSNQSPKPSTVTVITTQKNGPTPTGRDSSSIQKTIVDSGNHDDKPENPRGPSSIQWLLAITILPLGLSAPFATTGLGIYSINSIRNSGGLIYGLALALTDAIFYPLLILNAIIMVTFFSLISSLQDSFNPVFVLGCGLLICIVVDFLIARFAWKKVNSKGGSF